MVWSEVRSLVYCLLVVVFGVPLGLMLLEYLPLGVVSDVLNIDEAAQIEPFGPELCHGAGRQRMKACDKPTTQTVGRKVEDGDLGSRNAD